MLNIKMLTLHEILVVKILIQVSSINT